MAPKRKQGASSPSTPTRVTRSTVKASVRATRSATATGAASLQVPVDNPQPSKRTKTAAPTPAPAPAPVRDPDPAADVDPDAASDPAAAPAAGAGDPAVTIIIEHGRENRVFDTRATIIKNKLKKSVPGIKVVVNPEGPKEKSFVIRQEGGEEFLSLLNMEKPFQELKDLEIEKVVSDIAEKLNAQ